MNPGRLLLAASAVAVGAIGCHQNTTPTPALAALGSHALCADYSGLPPDWGGAEHAGMARIAAGHFDFGSMRGYAEERPVTNRHVPPFWIDRTAVTNAQFAEFVAATGYATRAESGGAAVFVAPEDPADFAGPGSWWRLYRDANWRHPAGTDSSIAGHANQPVVDVSLADAQAYAHWLGRSLPSEVQWEYAAKAGRDNTSADAAMAGSSERPAANAWQGWFPFQNSAADGFVGRAPVGCYSANPNGLYDMVGNVWEWTRDRWTPNHAAHTGDRAAHAAPVPMSTTPTTHNVGPANFNVIKGGSYLCARNYCARARAASRQPAEADLPAVHIGFRTVTPAH